MEKTNIRDLLARFQAFVEETNSRGDLEGLSKVGKEEKLAVSIPEDVLKSEEEAGLLTLLVSIFLILMEFFNKESVKAVSEENGDVLGDLTNQDCNQINVEFKPEGKFASLMVVLFAYIEYALKVLAKKEDANAEVEADEKDSSQMSDADAEADGEISQADEVVSTEEAED